MTTIIMILTALAFLIFSIIKSRSKTKRAVKVAKNMFINTFVEIVGVMAIVGFILALIPPDSIKNLLGGSNRLLSSLYGAVIGTITIMPAFIAFPLSKSLYVSGAHLMAIASFLTTLTMVGLATFPIEARHFGTKFTIIRNGISFAMALIIALGMGLLL